MRNLFLLGLLIINSFIIFGQNATDSTRKVAAVRTFDSFKIDGNPNEPGWKKGSLITGLIEQRPNFGKVESPTNRSEIYVLYDDNAVYMGGILYELTSDSISRELVGRDNVGVNDFVGIIFDTYQDKINGLGFYVTPLGEQFDFKYSIGNEDPSWNTVYESEAKITEQGWTFEMRIPYSAIRFSTKSLQDWNIQVLRRRTKTGQQYTWSPVDPQKFGFVNQAGTMTGIQDIKAPVRLSFSPYFSAYAGYDPFISKDKWSATFNGGMDVKYGINDAFTMDMTLIPDFGQVQSDNKILNLSPFEVRYDENRPFFNEGTELFNKGGLFYSRRIGGQPIHYYDVYGSINPGDSIVENPIDTKLMNALKISGRTRKKLGIGFFNAFTKAQYATVETSTKEQYRIETNPFTNYNVIVFDQALKNNSSVALVNTNVWRSGEDYDANVTALLWDLYDKNIDWNVWGQVTTSNLFGYEGQGKTLTGWQYNLFLGKFKGRFNFDIHRFFADDKYYTGDMGYFQNANYVTHGFYTGYKWTKPKGIYNNIYLNMNGNYSMRYKDPHDFQFFNINGNVNGQLKNLWSGGVNWNYQVEAQDFYEPRKEGRMVKLPSSGMVGFWLYSNRAKKYYAGVEGYFRRSSKYEFKGNQAYIFNSYRFSDKFSMSLTNNIEWLKNNFGYAYTTGDSIIFGLRDRNTVENVLNIKYNFNNKMGLTFRLRHYWSKVDYSKFFNLLENGYVEDVVSPNPNINPNSNVNLFNIDMNFTWQFAPGSFINITWKDFSELYDQRVTEQYFYNFGHTVSKPKYNTLSVKVIYYLDYLVIKDKFGKKKKQEPVEAIGHLQQNLPESYGQHRKFGTSR